MIIYEPFYECVDRVIKKKKNQKKGMAGFVKSKIGLFFFFLSKEIDYQPM